MTPPEQPTPPSLPEPPSVPWFLEEGDRVRDYTVRRPIGDGSGSIVYEVEDEAGVHFALKLSRAPLAANGKHPIECERFFQGAIVHFALRDSINVVRLADVSFLGTPQGAYPYLVMELVPWGECITTWAARTRPTLVNLVEIFIALADTLGTMADMKICHRDLKPQNILIESPRDIPKIIDLNSVSFPMQKTLTAPAASAIPGTLAYFSPELAAAVLAEMKTGETARYEYAPTDDLYSLGCVFYEVLTGQVPCCELNEPPATILRQIVRDKPPTPAELNEDVPWSVSKVVMKLLEKDPAKRYQSGHDVARELEAARHRTVEDTWFEPFIVPRPEAGSKLPSWLTPVAFAHRRLLVLFRRRWAGKLALAAMVMAAALVAWLILGQHCPPESSAEEGAPVLCKVKMALVAAASTTLSCVGLMGNVRAEDEKYLAECPAEAKDTVKSLHIAPYDLRILHDGPTVKAPGYGYEMKAGPIEVKPGILDHLGGGSLLGEIRVGSDGASVRFNKLRLNSDGIERPICGIAFADASGPGFMKMPKDDPNRVPDSKLHPNEGFIYVVGLGVYIELATSGPKPEMVPLRGGQSSEDR